MVWKYLHHHPYTIGHEVSDLNNESINSLGRDYDYLVNLSKEDMIIKKQLESITKDEYVKNKIRNCKREIKIPAVYYRNSLHFDGEFIIWGEPLGLDYILLLTEDKGIQKLIYSEIHDQKTDINDIAPKHVGAPSFGELRSFLSFAIKRLKLISSEIGEDIENDPIYQITRANYFKDPFFSDLLEERGFVNPKPDASVSDLRFSWISFQNFIYNQCKEITCKGMFDSRKYSIDNINEIRILFGS